MSKTVRQSNWATETLMEAPFWRNGMTPEEYETENRYLSKNFYKQKDGNYATLDARREHERIISSLDFFIYRQEMLYIESKTDCNNFLYYSILCLISYVVLITMMSLEIGFNRIYLYFLCNNLNF